MVDILAEYRVHQIHEHDGYPGEPIWEKNKNKSTYYNYYVDIRCKIPIGE